MSALAMGVVMVLSAARTLPLAVGDCSDAALQRASQGFSDRLKNKLGDQVLTGAAATAALKPRATASTEELQRQLSAAQKHFYASQHSKAEQQVEDALKEIALLPPGTGRSTLQATAYALQGLIRQARDKAAAADESFGRILRLDPNHQLDQDYYSPATRERFEQVRKKLAGAPRVALRVSSTPSGADVFLDGQNVGRTPFEGKFLAGAYQLQVASGAKSSFPRVINLSEATSTSVDLQMEGSVDGGAVLCIASRPQAAELLNDATKLGAQLGMEEVVLVQLRKEGSTTAWITATLLSVSNGQQVREGGMKLKSPDAQDGFDDLVAYVSTGRVEGAVVAPGNGPAPWQRLDVVTPDPERPHVTTQYGLRDKAWIPAVGGGALVVGGVVFTVLARGVESKIRGKDPSITNVDAAISQGQTYERVGAALIISGVVVGAASAAMFLFDKPVEPGGATIGVVPTKDGFFSVVSTTW